MEETVTVGGAAGGARRGEERHYGKSGGGVGFVKGNLVMWEDVSWFGL